MILSEMLWKLHQDRSLVENELFCELVILAWNDLQALFYRSYRNDRDNWLYGQKKEMEGPLHNTIHLLRSKVHTKDYLKNEVCWIEALHRVARIELGVTMQGELDKYLDRHQSYLNEMDFVKRMQTVKEQELFLEKTHKQPKPWDGVYH